MDRADWLYASWMDKVEKFDYFIGGGALALVGYLAPRLQLPQAGLTWGPGLEIAALAAILCSAFCALRRIEAGTLLTYLNSQRIASLQSAGTLMGVVGSGQTALNTRTGEIVEPSDAWKRANEEHQKAQSADAKFDEWAARARGWYRWRDRLLMAGLLLLVGSRVVPALLG